MPKVGTWIRVKASVEGLTGHKTAIGWPIHDAVPFVALPSHTALRKAIVVHNPANGRSVQALVLDVGPWNTLDDDYVFDGARPQAESGTDLYGRTTNGAGIDLGEYVRKALGITGMGEVEWAFLLEPTHS